jgi:hypothetical protein
VNWDEYAVKPADTDSVWLAVGTGVPTVQLNEAEDGEALMFSGGAAELMVNITRTLKGELIACESVKTTLPVYCPEFRFFTTVEFREMTGLEVGEVTVSQAPPVTVTNAAEYGVPFEPTVSVSVVTGIVPPKVKVNPGGALEVRVAKTWMVGVTDGAAR